MDPPRKPRRTAHRVWERIRPEHPDSAAAEPAVRRYVQGRKEDLRPGPKETFVPQSDDWGRLRTVQRLTQ